jgi:N-acetylglucosamine malate deacetylase 1
VAWGAGGTLLTLKAAGTSFGIVDLTRGEMGSRGTSEERTEEAEEAAAWMGARFRESLGLPDGGVLDSVESRNKIAIVIRRSSPKLVLAPYWEDRHPDQAATGHLDLCRLRQALPEEWGDREQVKFLLGHSSLQTSERYLGSEQEIAVAVKDNLGL